MIENDTPITITMTAENWRVLYAHLTMMELSVPGLQTVDAVNEIIGQLEALKIMDGAPDQADLLKFVREKTAATQTANVGQPK